MSQLDLSIFYSHLFSLLFLLYIFSHFAVMILINYYYNDKLRNIELENLSLNEVENSSINIINKILV